MLALAGRLPPVSGKPRAVAELVALSQRGDRGAFGELYLRMRAVAHGVALAHAPRGLAADVVQEAFAKAWARLDELREPAAFPGWLLEITRRKAIDAARRGRARSEAANDDADAEAPGASPSTRALAEQALRAVAELPAAYRETLLLRLVEGLSGPEISELTGMTPDSVRVNLSRGMKLLRARIEGGSP